MTDARPSRFVGRSILRREDQRLLIGQGQFIADIVLPRMLHAVFVRSPVAHGRIRAVDISRAASAPGVVLVLSGAELARLLPPVPDAQLSLPSKWRAQVEHKLHNSQPANSIAAPNLCASAPTISASYDLTALIVTEHLEHQVLVTIFESPATR